MRLRAERGREGCANRSSQREYTQGMVKPRQSMPGISAQSSHGANSKKNNARSTGAGSRLMCGSIRAGSGADRMVSRAGRARALAVDSAGLISDTTSHWNCARSPRSGGPDGYRAWLDHQQASGPHDGW